MVRIALIGILSLMVSCHTPKKMVEEQPKPEIEKEVPQTNQKHDDEVYYLAEVQVLDCGVVIQIFSGDTKYLYAPKSLDPKFQVDRQRLKVKFKVLDGRETACPEFPAIEITEAFAVR